MKQTITRDHQRADDYTRTDGWPPPKHPLYWEHAVLGMPVK